jgi:hypothetical protein
MIRGNRAASRLGVVLLGTAIALSACSTQGGDDKAAAPAAAEQAAPGEAGADNARTQNGAGTKNGAGAKNGGGAANPDAAGSSTGELAPYLAAAERADAQLRRAAALVNGGMTKDELRISPEAVRAIRAASPDTLAATVPAGMPPQLMRPVLLTFSELASRYYAMRFVLAAGDVRREVVVPRSRVVSPTLAQIVDALGNGAPAAARFERDLANAKALAAEHTPLPEAEPRSRAAAEIGIRLEHIVTANGCCMEAGGNVFTSLVPLRWADGGDRSSRTGTVNGIGFRVDWTGDRWDVRLAAG